MVLVHRSGNREKTKPHGQESHDHNRHFREIPDKDKCYILIGVEDEIRQNLADLYNRSRYYQLYDKYEEFYDYEDEYEDEDEAYDASEDYWYDEY